MSDLIKKLGVKEGQILSVVNAPKDYFKSLGKLPSKAKLAKNLKQADVIHFFTLTEVDLKKHLAALKKHLNPEGSLWISYLKGKKDIMSLNEKVVKELGSKTGLEPGKKTAINDAWLGMKFSSKAKK